MDRYEVGMLAISRAGHDLNQIYIIIDVDKEYVYLVDGLLRKIDNPKKKNKKHIQVIREVQIDIAEKYRNSQKIENEEIKRTIKLYKMRNADGR